jgi:hypothetical protein
LKIRFGLRDIGEPFSKDKVLYLWDPPFGYTIEETFIDGDGKESCSFESTWFSDVSVITKIALLFALIANLLNLIRLLIT